MDALETNYRSWLSTGERGNKQLWQLLGQVYELGPKLEKNGSAKNVLIAKVKAEPSVQANNQWKADRKSSTQLLLTLLLGLKAETKATKSQWQTALRAANNAKIPTDENACKSWLQEIGGVSGARKTMRKETPPAKTLDELFDELKDFHWDGPLPEPFIASAIEKKIGLVLVRETSDGKVQPFAIVENEKLLASVIKSFLADVARAEKSMVRSTKEIEQDRQKTARPKWRRYVKSGDFEGTLEEYIARGEPEY